jgi:hypothetical protein
MSELDKQDAIIFTNMCKFGFMIGNITIVIFDYNLEIYNKYGINFSTLTHLDKAGLINFDHLSGFVRKGLPKEILIYYYGVPIKIFFPLDQNNDLKYGTVLLSKAGQQLATICGSSPENEIKEYTIKQWESKGLLIECDKGT